VWGGGSELTNPRKESENNRKFPFETNLEAFSANIFRLKRIQQKPSGFFLPKGIHSTLHCLVLEATTILKIQTSSKHFVFLEDLCRVGKRSAIRVEKRKKDGKKKGIRVCSIFWYESGRKSNPLP
jgi:hypothetical protein